MKISNIRIKGFKGIGELSVNLKNVNVLIGRNNTGKTSLLEAVYYTIGNDIDRLQSEYETRLSSLINRDEAESEVSVRMGNEDRSTSFSKPELNEILVELKKTILKNLERGILRFSSNGLSQRFHKHPEVKTEDMIAEVGKIIDKVFSNPKNLNDLTDQSIRCERAGKSVILWEAIPQVSPYLEELSSYLMKKKGYEFLAEYLEFGISRPSFRPDEEKNIISFIEKLKIEPRSGRIDQSSMDELGINKSKINEIQEYLKDNQIVERLIRFDFDKLLFEDENNREYEVPYFSMGSGFQALVGLIARIKKENRIVFIEESENHMHPEYIGKLVSILTGLAKKENIQLFISTYNSDVLNFLVRGDIKPDYREYLDKELNIIRLGNHKGNIFAEQLSLEEAKMELEGINMDLRGLE